ncbi:hypothetical protein SK128_014691, partial [Halocaridina rubra]
KARDYPLLYQCNHETKHYETISKRYGNNTVSGSAVRWGRGTGSVYIQVAAKHEGLRSVSKRILSTVLVRIARPGNNTV